jgi:hypothetical protein
MYNLYLKEGIMASTQSKRSALLTQLKNPWWTILVIVVPSLIGTFYDTRMKSIELEEKQLELIERKADLEDKTAEFEQNTLTTSKDLAAAIEALRKEGQMAEQAIIQDLELLHDRTRVLEPCCMEEDLFVRARAEDILKVDTSNIDINLLRELIKAIEGHKEPTVKRVVKSRPDRQPQIQAQQAVF